MRRSQAHGPENMSESSTAGTHVNDMRFSCISRNSSTKFRHGRGFETETAGNACRHVISVSFIHAAGKKNTSVQRESDVSGSDL